MSDEIAEWGPGSYPTKLRLKRFKGRRYIDVRKHYGDKPTRKGIMLNSAQYEALVESLVLHGDRVREWFGNEEEDVSDQVTALHNRLLETRRREQTTLPDAEVDVKSRPGQSLFSIEFRGSEASIELNASHPFISRLDKAAEAGDSVAVRHLLALVLQSSFHAIALGSPETDLADFETAEQHAEFMSLLLNRALREENT